MLQHETWVVKIGVDAAKNGQQQCGHQHPSELRREHVDNYVRARRSSRRTSKPRTPQMFSPTSPTSTIPRFDSPAALIRIFTPAARSIVFDFYAQPDSAGDSRDLPPAMRVSLIIPFALPLWEPATTGWEVGGAILTALRYCLDILEAVANTNDDAFVTASACGCEIGINYHLQKWCRCWATFDLKKMSAKCRTCVTVLIFHGFGRTRLTKSIGTYSSRLLSSKF